MSRGSSVEQLGEALPYVRLGDGARAVQLALGGFHSCALLEAGGSVAKVVAKCWGANEWGQLGYGDTLSRGAEPQRSGAGGMGERLPAIELVPAGSADEPVELSAGRHFSCARLSPSGAVKCWGGNIYEQLGHGSGEEDVGTRPGEMGAHLPPVANLQPADLLASSAAGYFSCARPERPSGGDGAALGDDALLRCWPAPNGVPPHGGDAYERSTSTRLEGNYGEEHRRFKHHGPDETQLLGKLPPSQSLALARAAAGGADGTAGRPSISLLALSMGSVCAVVEPTGELHCYGNNHEGQLGRGDTRSEPLPPQGTAQPLELGTLCATLARDAPLAFDAERAEAPGAGGAGSAQRSASTRRLADAAVAAVAAVAVAVTVRAARARRARRRRDGSQRHDCGAELL